MARNRKRMGRWTEQNKKITTMMVTQRGGLCFPRIFFVTWWFEAAEQGVGGGLNIN